MSLGAYTIIRNEVHWVGFCVMAAKDIVSDFVYFDGNSTDGTPELLEYIAKKYDINIKVVRDQDPKDLKDDYVRVFNGCLNTLTTKYAFFLHPDMIITDHNGPLKVGPFAYSTNMDSFCGDPQGWISRFTEGRTDKWKNIMIRDFGLHYFGHYGVSNEDMYFKDITGSDHVLHSDFKKYPYKVHDSGIKINHYSDVRTYRRRLTRMASCLTNEFPNLKKDAAEEVASAHPRVILEPHFKYPQFKFEPVTKHPEVFTKHNAEFAYVVGKKPEDFCLLPIGDYNGN